MTNAETSEYVTSSYADAEGNYTAGNLPAGSYKLQFFDYSNIHLGEWYGGTADQASATVVALAPAQQLTGIDLTLVKSAAISGQVTAPTGVDLNGISVSVHTADGMSIPAYAPVAGDGSYKVIGLPAGSYKVLFSGNSSGALDRWYEGAQSIDTATPLTLAAGQERTGINATLDKGATVSGRVTAPEGVDLTAVSVRVHKSDYFSYSGYGQVSPDGSYTVKGLPAGNYKVHFDAYNSGAPDQWYADADSFNTATSIPLAQGQDLTGIDAAMVKGATISGQVTVPAGMDVTSITVQAYASNSTLGFPASTWVSQDGSYRIAGLPAGTYKVQFSGNSSGALDQWAANAESEEAASPITLVPGQDVTGVDAALVKAATISGRVTAPAGVDLTGVTVRVHRSDSMSGSGSVQVDQDGSYRVTGLAAGSYKVQFDGNRSGALDQWHAGAHSFETATPLTLGTGQDLTGINETLVKAASISGRVTLPAGVDAASIYLNVYSSEDRNSSRWFQVKADGSYTAGDLAAGSYKIQFAGDGTGTLAQWHAGAKSFETATAITLSEGQDLTGIDADLVTGASISGLVSAPAGVDLARVRAYLFPGGSYDWSSTVSLGADGSYKFVGLPAGSYKIQFDASDSGALDRWYGGALTSAEATAITLADGQASTNADATLIKAASISGQMVAPAGVDIAAVNVAVYNTDNARAFPLYAEVQSDGSYRVSGLTSGNYKIRYSGYDSGALEQWHENGTSMATATTVAVAPGQDLSGIKATLIKGATISGTVSAPAGVRLTSTYVTAVSEADPYRPGASVNSDGTYKLKGLAAGTYKLNFQGNSGALEEWFEDAQSEAEATPVTVTSGQDRTGINATLAKGASISGKVTLPEGVSPYSVYVSLYRTGETLPTGTAYLDDAGTYTFRGLLAGGYKLQFRGYENNSGVLQQWYSNATSIGTATEVAVTAGQDRSAIDVTMKKGASISGKVTAPAAVNLSAAQVHATLAGAPADSAAVVWVATDGTYTIAGLEPGTYKVRFSGEQSGATDTWYGGTTADTATLVTLAAEEAKPAIDMAVGTGGSIQGKVTGTVSGYSYPITVFDQAGKAIRTTQTDAAGNYSLVGLTAGSYKVAFNRSNGYYGDEAQFYSNKPESAGLEQAQAITLAQNQSVQNIDATLKRGGSITGTLLDKAGKPLPNAYVEAYTRDGSFVTRMGFSDDSGKYSIGGLTTGKYLLHVLAYMSPGNLYSGNTAEEASAIPVAVTSGSATTFDLSYAVPQLTAPAPTIAGTAKVDSTLTAEPGTWGPSPVTLSYQWKADGADIAGATANTYKPTAVTVGKMLTVTVTGTKDGYTTETKTSAATAKVAAAALTAPTPTISGTAKVDSTLTAVPGTWGPAPVTLMYQWNADGISITGATAGTYKVTAATVGKTLTVTVAGSKADYATETRTSAATAKVAAGTLTAPTPTVKGTAKVGSTLTATVGTWGPSPVALKYQWKANGAAITGATAATFKPAAAQVGKTLTFSVTGTKTGYTTATKTSAATGTVMALNPVLTAPTPRITGTAKVGYTLTAVPGPWGPAAVTLRYQWKANGGAIAGATASTYKPAAAVVGKTISVSVTGSKAGYNTAAKTSALTARVAVGTLSAPAPRITGTAKVGYTLTAVPGAWGPAPVALKYQWKANGVAVAGATASTYKPAAAVVGKTMSVTVTGSKAGYTTTAKTSAVTAKIAVGTLTAPVPGISGAVRVGSVLTATGAWGPAPVTLKYQWKANGVAIPGATAGTYTPSTAVLGKTLAVTVTGSKSGFTSVTKTSAVSVKVAAGVLTVPAPTVSGTATVGTVLTAVPGTWGPAPVSLKYQWYANGVALAGATASTYKPLATDMGKTLTVTVAGSKAGFTTAAKTSATTAAVS
ncbi:carboxypeptidase regulatory-like domain-containing protein [Arthrobacter globiformis]|uniref:carboxypeptidase regulatory-like domain-containing protein n=1 Tax=Arthrobacter globiformis TaxID=1665 RepID=UPI00167CFCB3|nr:carboxypeptidase regulatory-like domain-containing protein [Arthrobacter globiformis]